MISTLIKEARNKAGIKQVDLAEKVGISVATLIRYESGEREPKASEIKRIAKELNINVAYLFGESDTASRADDLKLFDSQIVVPIYRDIILHCGDGADNTQVDGTIEQYMPLPSETLGVKDASQVFGYYVRGNSMEAAKISDGDIVLVRTCGSWNPPHYGDPCFVRYEKDGFPVDAIKFYYPRRDGMGVTLKSAEGSGVPELSFSKDDIDHGNPNIVGVVIQVIQMHSPIAGR
ncbi:MAG: helix-turn-helix domain-containing protein [bacterium]|nr:helix-turn-helix domain-containing protein [bacterium]